MNWKAGFAPERKIDWSDVADYIRDSVPMIHAVDFYYPELTPRHGRIPCPLHGGKDYNFSLHGSVYKCFVCGASGDVITFVKETQGCSTRVDAMKRINADFHLNLPIDANVTANFSEEMERRRARREAKNREIERWWDTYHALTDEWTELDKIKRTADPESEEYANAVKRIDYVAHKLDSLPSEPR